MRNILIFAQLAFIALMGISSGASAADTVPLKADAKQLYGQMPSDIILGNEKSAVTVIEYSSLSCPHCAHFQTKIFPALKAAYIDSGKIKFIQRDFPLDEPALRGAILAHCAGKERYHLFLKVLFDKQESWAFQKNYLEVLTNIGKLGGLSSEKIDACMKDKAMETAVIESKLTAANTLDIKATPTFFVNGERLSGVGDISSFKETIDRHLAQATPKTSSAQ
jgi:protein-disulfide isomerase